MNNNTLLLDLLKELSPNELTNMWNAYAKSKWGVPTIETLDEVFKKWWSEHGGTYGRKLCEGFDFENDFYYYDSKERTYHDLWGVDFVNEWLPDLAEWMTAKHVTFNRYDIFKAMNGGKEMRVRKLENIVAKINGAKTGTRFYFSNGEMIQKTRSDYGFTGSMGYYKVFRDYTFDFCRKGFWAEKNGNVSESLIEEVSKMGYLKNIEETEDTYRVDPMFT